MESFSSRYNIRMSIVLILLFGWVLTILFSIEMYYRTSFLGLTMGSTANCSLENEQHTSSRISLKTAFLQDMTLEIRPCLDVLQKLSFRISSMAVTWSLLTFCSWTYWLLCSHRLTQLLMKILFESGSTQDIRRSKTTIFARFFHHPLFFSGMDKKSFYLDTTDDVSLTF